MGSVNTLIRTKRGWAGWNTDGAGALDALAKYTVIAGQHIVILGAGGTARAIAYESIKRGASVFIANRTKEKAQELASLFSCQAGGIEDIPSVYDIIILCSPKIPSNLCSEQLLPGTLAMDVVYVPKETPFLQLAKSRGCRLVYGEEMFVQQAEQQRRLWTLP
ncbi:MAG: hypothetical protein FJZ58_05645 [Chlamydiae bacterium]|nr:hypothetical protein [Chlamydiota bacterium]